MEHQFLDRKGNPLKDSKLFFYEEPSGKLADIYRSRTLRSKSANPIELTEEGKLPYKVYILNGEKKIISLSLMDSRDRTLWQVDNLSIESFPEN